jgi:hypothetical protein
MVRFFCDRCELEVEAQHDLVSFTCELGDAVSAWRHRRELCAKCVEEAKDVITKLCAKPGANRKRTA